MFRKVTTQGELIRQVANRAVSAREGVVAQIDADTMRVRLDGSQSIVRGVRVVNQADIDAVAIGAKVLVEIRNGVAYATVI